MAENPTESTPKKSVASKAGVCSVCRCCNDNIFERKHPIDLYGAKATKESILSLLEGINATSKTEYHRKLAVLVTTRL